MTQVQTQIQTQTQTGFGLPAQTYLNDDRAAQALLARRQRCLAGLQEDLADPHNGYTSLQRTQQGWEIRTQVGTFIAVSLVCAQAFVLAKFW